MTSAAAVATGRDRDWAIVALVVAVFALFHESALAMAARWRDPVNTTYSHGYLIVALSVWLLWRDRARLRGAFRNARPSALGATALLLAGLVWLMALWAGIEFGFTLMLPVVLGLALLAFFGWGVARCCAFAVAYLYFATQLWDLCNPGARWSTIYAVRSALRLFGIPAYFEGDRIQIPEGTFEIEDGCSGLHFLVVALALGALIGELDRSSWKVRLKILAASLVFALLVNWVRVFAVIIAGHFTHMQHFLVRVDHRFFGWALFALALPALFALVRFLQTPDRTRVADAGSQFVLLRGHGLGQLLGEAGLEIVLLAKRFLHFDEPLNQLVFFELFVGVVLLEQPAEDFEPGGKLLERGFGAARF